MYAVDAGANVYTRAVNVNRNSRERVAEASTPDSALAPDRRGCRPLKIF